MSTAVAEPLTETNPNRPTEPGYCANCGSMPCRNAWLKRDPNPKHPEWQCIDFSWPHPRTEFFAWIDTVNRLQHEHPEIGFFPGMDCNEISDMVVRNFWHENHRRS